MKKLIQICFVLYVTSSAFAQTSSPEDQIHTRLEQQRQQELQTSFNPQNNMRVLHVYDWKDLMSQHPFPNSQIISMDGMSVLKIENTNDSQLEISLLKITNSAVVRKADSISWEMKYEDIDTSWYSPTNGHLPYQGAVLRLLNYIPPSAPGGDERIIVSDRSSEGGWAGFGFTGTSNWKLYSTEVHRTPNAMPERLEFHLWLSGKGTIYLRPLKLMGIKNNWWSSQQAGLIGGIGGSLFGCLGGLLGCLAGMGKARRFVLGMTKILIALGIVMAIAGIVAVASGQPYAVWYPLVLTGGILTFVFSVNLYPVKKRYDDQEIRRMTSMDATGR